MKVTDNGWSIRYLIDDSYTTFRDENYTDIFDVANLKMHSKLKGRIMLKVEDSGKAYYVTPNNTKMYYLGRPDDAFNIMKSQGIGISENDFMSFDGYAPKRLSGTIILRVESKGEAYYINPVDLKMHYLGRPKDAFDVMKNLGEGISNTDFENMID